MYVADVEREFFIVNTLESVKVRGRLTEKARQHCYISGHFMII